VVSSLAGELLTTQHLYHLTWLEDKLNELRAATWYPFSLDLWRLARSVEAQRRLVQLGNVDSLVVAAEHGVPLDAGVLDSLLDLLVRIDALDLLQRLHTALRLEHWLLTPLHYKSACLRLSLKVLAFVELNVPRFSVLHTALLEHRDVFAMRLITICDFTLECTKMMRYAFSWLYHDDYDDVPLLSIVLLLSRVGVAEAQSDDAVQSDDVQKSPLDFSDDEKLNVTDEQLDALAAVPAAPKATATTPAHKKTRPQRKLVPTANERAQAVRVESRENLKARTELGIDLIEAATRWRDNKRVLMIELYTLLLRSATQAWEKTRLNDTRYGEHTRLIDESTHNLLHTIRLLSRHYEIEPPLGAVDSMVGHGQFTAYVNFHNRWLDRERLLGTDKPTLKQRSASYRLSSRCVTIALAQLSGHFVPLPDYDDFTPYVRRHDVKTLEHMFAQLSTFSRELFTPAHADFFCGSSLRHPEIDENDEIEARNDENPLAEFAFDFAAGVVDDDQHALALAFVERQFGCIQTLTWLRSLDVLPSASGVVAAIERGLVFIVAWLHQNGVAVFNETHIELALRANKPLVVRYLTSQTIVDAPRLVLSSHNIDALIDALERGTIDFGSPSDAELILFVIAQLKQDSLLKSSPPQTVLVNPDEEVLAGKDAMDLSSNLALLEQRKREIADLIATVHDPAAMQNYASSHSVSPVINRYLVDSATRSVKMRHLDTLIAVSIGAPPEHPSFGHSTDFVFKSPPSSPRLQTNNAPLLAYETYLNARLGDENLVEEEELTDFSTLPPASLASSTRDPFDTDVEPSKFLTMDEVLPFNADFYNPAFYADVYNASGARFQVHRDATAVPKHVTVIYREKHHRVVALEHDEHGHVNGALVRDTAHNGALKYVHFREAPLFTDDVFTTDRRLLDAPHGFDFSGAGGKRSRAVSTDEEEEEEDNSPFPSSPVALEPAVLTEADEVVVVVVEAAAKPAELSFSFLSKAFRAFVFSCLSDDVRERPELRELARFARKLADVLDHAVGEDQEHEAWRLVERLLYEPTLRQVASLWPRAAQPLFARQSARVYSLLHKLRLYALSPQLLLSDAHYVQMTAQLPYQLNHAHPRRYCIELSGNVVNAAIFDTPLFEDSHKLELRFSSVSPQPSSFLDRTTLVLSGGLNTLCYKDTRESAAPLPKFGQHLHGLELLLRPLAKLVSLHRRPYGGVLTPAEFSQFDWSFLELRDNQNSALKLLRLKPVLDAAHINAARLHTSPLLSLPPIDALQGTNALAQLETLALNFGHAVRFVDENSNADVCRCPLVSSNCHHVRALKIKNYGWGALSSTQLAPFGSVSRLGVVFEPTVTNVQSETMLAITDMRTRLEVLSLRRLRSLDLDLRDYTRLTALKLSLRLDLWTPVTIVPSPLAPIVGSSAAVAPSLLVQAISRQAEHQVVLKLETLSSKLETFQLWVERTERVSEQTKLVCRDSLQTWAAFGASLFTLTLSDLVVHTPELTPARLLSMLPNLAFIQMHRVSMPVFTTRAAHAESSESLRENGVAALRRCTALEGAWIEVYSAEQERSWLRSLSLMARQTLQHVLLVDHGETPHHEPNFADELSACAFGPSLTTLVYHPFELLVDADSLRRFLAPLRALRVLDIETFTNNFYDDMPPLYPQRLRALHSHAEFSTLDTATPRTSLSLINGKTLAPFASSLRHLRLVCSLPRALAEHRRVHGGQFNFSRGAFRRCTKLRSVELSLNRQQYDRLTWYLPTDVPQRVYYKLALDFSHCTDLQRCSLRNVDQPNELDLTLPRSDSNNGCELSLWSFGESATMRQAENAALFCDAVHVIPPQSGHSLRSPIYPPPTKSTGLRTKARVVVR